MFLFYQPSALRCCIYLHTRFRRSCCWPRLTLLSTGLATRRSRLDEQDEQRTGDITTPRRKVRPAQVSLGVLPSPLFFSSSFWLQVFFFLLLVGSCSRFGHGQQSRELCHNRGDDAEFTSTLPLSPNEKFINRFSRSCCYSSSQFEYFSSSKTLRDTHTQKNYISKKKKRKTEKKRLFFFLPLLLSFGVCMGFGGRRNSRSAATWAAFPYVPAPNRIVESPSLFFRMPLTGGSIVYARTLTHTLHLASFLFLFYLATISENYCHCCLSTSQ